MTRSSHQPRALGAGRRAAVPVGRRSSTTRSSTPARRTRRTSSAGGANAARGAHGRHEPGPVRHGADGRAVRRRRDGARLRRYRGPVGKPPREHPRRPIAGFACQRAEVSGTRFWGWARDRFGTAERFFERVFVANWCPLVFMDESGGTAARTSSPPPSAPALPRLQRRARDGSSTSCDPRSWSVSGASPSSARGRRSGATSRIGRILHPSPASPAANNAGRGSSTRSSARSASSRRSRAPVASDDAPSEQRRADAPDGDPALGAQPQRHEVHPRARARAALVRDGPVRARGAIFVVPHAARERTLRIERRHLPVLLLAPSVLWLNQVCFVFALDATTASTIGLPDRHDPDLRRALRGRPRASA